MIIYVELFLIASLFYAVGIFFEEGGVKFLSNISTMGVILILGLFAGARDNTVGTDVNFYMAPSFNYATLYPSFHDYHLVYPFEYLYALLSYYISVFTNSTFLFFSVLMILSLVFFLASIDFSFKGVYRLFPFVLLLIGFYNLSLNYSRQMIAISILLYIYKYLKTQNYLLYFFGIAVAFGFHRTALIGIVIFFVYNIDKLSIKIRFYLNFFLASIYIVFLIFYDKLLIGLINSGIISHKYVVHLSEGVNFPIIELIFHAFVLILLIILMNNSALSQKESLFFKEMALLDFLLLLIYLISDTAYRIELYSFAFIILLILPKVLYAGKYRVELKTLIVMLVVFAFLGYWYITIVVQGNGQTVPYTSQILNIG